LDARFAKRALPIEGHEAKADVAVSPAFFCSAHCSVFRHTLMPADH
jgi:hypothetical protein